MAVLYLSDSLRGAVFQTAFAAALPDMPFHIGQAPDPLAVRYLVTWTAPDDLAARFPSLRLIFSVGAGVDQFDLAALPPHVGVVRMLEPGIPQQMQEYVTLATLALFVGFGLTWRQITRLRRSAIGDAAKLHSLRGEFDTLLRAKPPP